MDVDKSQFVIDNNSHLPTDHWLVTESFRNENRLATQFIDKHGDQLRWVPGWKRWLVWDGKRWKEDVDSCKVLAVARQFVDDLWREFALVARIASRDEVAMIHTFIKRANDHRVISSILALSRSDKRIVIEHDQLNAETGILNVENGILDLLSGDITKHDPRRNITKLCPIRYDLYSGCPQFLKMLDLIFDGDAELIRYVRALLGYAISGDCSEQILPIAYGNGHNGKSTLTDILLAILGKDYADAAHEGLLLGNRYEHPTDKCHLYGKRFVPISEQDAGAQMKESRVKELTGDSFITARGMKQDFWSFRRTHTFWMSTNHLPAISGSDEGIWRRLKCIPFRVDVRKKTTVEPGLDKRLVREEGTGILRWLMEGYQDYRKHGFCEPAAVMTATNDYRCEEDEIGRFVAERCYLTANGISTAEEIFKLYQQWGGKKNHTQFGREMAKRFKKDTPTSGTYRRKTIYFGLAILSGSSEAEESLL
jgi:putative DNA primase/helicase